MPPGSSVPPRLDVGRPSAAAVAAGVTRTDCVTRFYSRPTRVAECGCAGVGKDQCMRVGVCVCVW